jgi:hypothetical protein
MANGVVDFLEEQRAHRAELRAKANKATRSADARYVEDCVDVAGIAYPWDERPLELLLERSELSLALKLAKQDIEEAARLLRVSVERLELALDQHPEWTALVRKRRHYRERVGRQDEALNAPVIAAWNGSQFVVTIKKPKWDSALAVGFDEAGNFVVTITRKLSASEV